ncbi:hypothetical protein [Caryophanon tenue]|uniref:hypothetical protein n=1 Tax=Caryophanon tenue TaxID=33978 RepID=UPI00147120CC|nr:hypothetical protein [Caryophanon tenue]
MKGRKYFAVSFLFTIIVLMFAVMNEPPVFYTQFQDELFLVAGTLLVTSVLRQS